MEQELELFETQEEAYVKNDIDLTKEAFLEKRIEDLEEIIKEQALKIKHLEGQISVYKKYMFSESEEN